MTPQEIIKLIQAKKPEITENQITENLAAEKKRTGGLLGDETLKQNRWDVRPVGVPAEWAVQSFVLARAALLPPHADVDEAYYKAQIPVIDERLALAGLRLASLLNSIFSTPPPAK